MTNVNQEADMGYVRDFVAKVAEALVAATELPKQMEQIKFDMATLADDLSRTKTKNIELDTMLNDTRRQRDEAEQALSQAKRDLTEANLNADAARNEQIGASDRAKALQVKVDSLTKERDDYGLQAMSAEDRAKAAEAKLDKLREAMGMPKEVAPVALSKPEPESMPTPNAPQAEPTKRLYESEYNYYEQIKAKPEHFDINLKQYYIEV